jgi:hypothetical protein
VNVGSFGLARRANDVTLGNLARDAKFRFRHQVAVERTESVVVLDDDVIAPAAAARRGIFHNDLIVRGVNPKVFCRRH